MPQRAAPMSRSVHPSNNFNRSNDHRKSANHSVIRHGDHKMNIKLQDHKTKQAYKNSNKKAIKNVMQDSIALLTTKSEGV